VVGRVRQSAVLVGVGLIAGLAVGGVVAVLAIPAPVPASLASGQALETVRPPVTEFTDPREVRVALSFDSLSAVRSPRAGLLTALSCVPGQDVVAGSTPFAVDGAPVVALATSVPLWRDIPVGEEGPDVAALESELVRLGGAVAADGTWSWSDALAFDAFLGGAGVVTTDDGTVPLGSIAWLPSSTSVVAECPVALGTDVGPGAVVAQFAARVSRASVVLPEEAVEGERALAVGDSLIPIGPDGAVTDPAALALLADSPEFAEVDRSTTPPTMSATVVLATPRSVTVVPPSAVYSVSGDRGCVTGPAGSTPVTIVASQLGRTLVEPAQGQPLGDVLVHPESGAACR
jgi:hypothetical protein